MTPLLLGLDVSKLRLGWAVIHLDTGAPVAAGCEQLDVKGGGWLHEQTSQAVRDLGVKILNIPGHVCSEVEVACREEPITRFPKVAKEHGAVCALVDAEVRRRWPHAPYWTLMPSEWRRRAGLPGNATKDRVVRTAHWLALQADWGEAACDQLSASQDACDALLVARAAWDQWHTDARTGDAA